MPCFVWITFVILLFQQGTVNALMQARTSSSCISWYKPFIVSSNRVQYVQEKNKVLRPKSVPILIRSNSGIIPPVKNNVTDLALDFTQLEPFLKIAVPFFKQDKVARNSLIAVTALTLLNSGISVAFSYISRDFYNALNAHDEALFYEKIELFFAALVLAVPVSVYYRFVREKLAIYWRDALTKNVLDKYFSNRTFYIVETMRDVDNPDQRITEDIRRFTSTSLDFFITLFTSVIDLLAFSAILFQIYPGLFVAIVGYAGVGSLVTTKLGRSLVQLNYERLQREADFRCASNGVMPRTCPLSSCFTFFY